MPLKNLALIKMTKWKNPQGIKNIVSIRDKEARADTQSKGRISLLGHKKRMNQPSPRKKNVNS